MWHSQFEASSRRLEIHFGITEPPPAVFGIDPPRYFIWNWCWANVPKKDCSSDTPPWMWGKPDHKAFPCSWKEQHNAVVLQGPTGLDHSLDHKHRLFFFGKGCIIGQRQENTLSNWREELIREAFGWRAYAHRCDSSQKINIFKLNHRFCILKAGRGDSHEQFFVLAARHYTAITSETQLQVWAHSEKSYAKVHVWSAFLHSKPGSLHSSISSFWGADRHFPFVRRHCAQTQLWPFSKKPSTQLQISKADFILWDVEHKRY